MLNFLGRIANILSANLFRPIHWLFQKLMSWSVPRILRCLYGYEWKLRRSIIQSGGYHFLFSDVDLALVLPTNVNLQEAERTIHRYLSVKKYLKFLGELEVYFAHEWEEKINLETGRFAGALGIIRDFRKLRWCELDFERYADLYHHSKARRAIEKIKKSQQDMKCQLRPWVSELHWQWLESLDSEGIGYVHYYDRNLRESVPFDLFQFFRCVAIGPQSKKLKPDEPLYFLRQIVHRYELLNYQAYFRVKERSLFAKDDWIFGIENEIYSATPVEPIGHLRTFRLSEIDREALPVFFNISLGEINEKSLSLFKPTWGSALAKAWSIESQHPLSTLWMKMFFPQYFGKIRENYTELKKSIDQLGRTSPSRIPKKNVLSWVFPIDERYGSAHLSHVLAELEGMTGESFRVEICVPELPSLEFLSQFFKCQSEIVHAPFPTGVIVLPTLWNLNEDLQNVKEAQKWNLPVVAGYDSQFSRRVFDCYSKGESSIRLRLDHFQF